MYRSLGVRAHVVINYHSNKFMLTKKKKINKIGHKIREEEVGPVLKMLNMGRFFVRISLQKLQTRSWKAGTYRIWSTLRGMYKE